MTRKLSSTKEGSVESTFEAKPYTGKTAFEQWVEYEGIPMIRNFIVPDLNLLALKSWDRSEPRGAGLCSVRRKISSAWRPIFARSVLENRPSRNGICSKS